MKKTIVALMIATLIAAAYPIVRTAIAVGQEWRGVIPSLVDDDAYYYARMHAVLSGDIQIGNPYYIEHRSEIAVAFFASDWLAAIAPFVLHSFVAGVIMNALVWPVVFVLLGYVLLRRLGISDRIAAIAAFGLYLQSYYFFVRPVSLQTILPFGLFFWLVLWNWAQNALGAEKQRVQQWKVDVMLIAGIVAPFYIYTYLWQIVVVTMIVLYGALCWLRKWNAVKRLTIVGAIAVLGIVPMLWYLMRQLQHPNYWETVRRIGLVQTHVPTSYAMMMAALTIGVVAAWVVAWLSRWMHPMREQTRLQAAGMMLTGMAFALVTVSNILTGKELEIGNHVARFLFPWFGISAVLFARDVWRWGSWKRMTMTAFVAIPAVMGFQNLSFLRTLPLAGAVEAQKNVGVVEWLNAQKQSSVVVLAPDDLSGYIPMLTKDFVVFQSNGGLHLMSSQEVQERYLVSHVTEELTADELVKRYRAFAGVGPSMHEWLTYNREVLMCRALHLDMLGKTCGSPVSGVREWCGDAYFQQIASDAEKIRTNIVPYLEKYHVAYIVVPVSQDVTQEQKTTIGLTEAYRDDAFIVYRRPEPTQSSAK